MALIGKEFDGNSILKGWFNPNQPILSIFEKRKPLEIKEIPEDVLEMVEGWIEEGEKQRHERTGKNKRGGLVYSSSTT